MLLGEPLWRGPLEKLPAGDALSRAVCQRMVCAGCLKAAIFLTIIIITSDAQEHLMPHIIALVDDDRNFLTSIAITLEEEGFVVRSYADSLEAVAGLAAQPVDLAILDVRMPHMDGMELLGHIRKSSRVPVIFLTSMTQEIDEVLGLRMGTDDYLTKPFSQRLLIERIHALLRRAELVRGNRIVPEPMIDRGRLCLNMARHECTWMGYHIDLTATEFLVLRCLALRPGQIKNRRQLMVAAFGDNIHVDERTIDGHVKRLRRKFKTVDPNFAQVETTYGVGYRFTEK
jgi:two-component system, OmpR family, response regulator ChvI